MMKDQIQQRSAQILDEVIAIRRHIHQHPELSFEETETSKFVQEKLNEWGIEFKVMANTGVVGMIYPTSSSSDTCIALRADLDALPIHEETNVDYKSKNEGIMHACGHDVHTAILLGTAKILNEFRDQLSQPVKLIFQPGEEKLPGGASLMINEGVLEDPKVNEIYALHVFPELEAGKVGLKSGMYMASCDEVYITVNGKGGHGAMPEQNIDPIAISAQLITGLQQIVSRSCPPQIPCVLSFGRIEGLGATNVIPEKVHLEGTFRTMNEEWRSRAHELIKEKSQGMAKSFGGSADVRIEVGYPYLENDPVLTEKAREKAKTILGDENVIDLPLRLTGEDFAFFSQHVPATFIRIGVRNEDKGIIHPVHNSKFDIEESALEIGIHVFLAQVLL